MAGIRTSTVLHRDGIHALVKALDAQGRTVIGPTVRDGAVVLTELASADQLPYGWGDRMADGHLSVVEERPVRPSYAFLRVRPCDLRAVAIQDPVLTRGRYQDSGYQERRQGAFLIAAEHTEPGTTCFCPGCGPGNTRRGRNKGRRNNELCPDHGRGPSLRVPGAAHADRF